MKLYEAIGDAQAELKLIENLATQPKYQSALAEIRHDVASIQIEIEWIKAQLRIENEPAQSRQLHLEEPTQETAATDRLARELSGEPDERKKNQ